MTIPENDLVCVNSVYVIPILMRNQRPRKVTLVTAGNHERMVTSLHRSDARFQPRGNSPVRQARNQSLLLIMCSELHFRLSSVSTKMALTILISIP